MFAKGWDPAEVEKARIMVERGDTGLGMGDAGWVAEAMVRFCGEDVEGVDA